MGNERYRRMPPYRRRASATDGKQVSSGDGVLQQQRECYKSANTVFAERTANGRLVCWRQPREPKHLHRSALSTLCLPTSFARNASCHNDYGLLNVWVFRTSSHSDRQLDGNRERFIGQQWVKSPLLRGASLQLWQSRTCQEGGCQLALSMCHHFGLPSHS